MMLLELAALLKVAFQLSVTLQVHSSSFSNAQVIIQNQDRGILSKPSAYVIGPNRTTLVICKANSRGIPYKNDLPGDVLHVKCKGLRHKARFQYFSTTDDDTPPVTTSRLVVTSHLIKRFKTLIICYCTDASTKEKGPGLVISMKPERHRTNLTHFKPKRNRIRTVALGRFHKISWRFPNSSLVRCFHDGQPLTKDQVVHGVGKVSVLINEALRKDAGFYYCRSKSGVFSPWLQLQVEGGWSKWHPWLACSTHCGLGRKIEIRRCRETRFIQERCQGLGVRALPCVGHSCGDMVPQFIDEPADQVILNGSSTNVTCSAQFGSSMFNLQMICTSSNWSYSIIQNKTTVGSFPNNTEARIKYRIDLHRERGGVAVHVFCHCYAFDRQLTKSSRIAKISFPSVEATRPPSSSASSTLNSYIVCLGLGGGVLVFIGLVSILAVNVSRAKRKDGRNGSVRRKTKETIPPHPGITQSVTHFERPDTKVITVHSSVSSGDEDTLESRDSTSPLLRYGPDHDELYETIECCKSHPSEDLAEKIDFGKSAFQREESWKSNKSKISAFSSVSAAFCPKPKLPNTVDPDLCAWGKFTEKGGRLTIEDTGVSLYIPPDALTAEQTSQVIYIGLMNSKGNYPRLSNQQALLSPVVVCGPDGLTFQKPVFLNVPHNAVLDKNNYWNPKVQSCSTVNEDEGENKWKTLETPGGDAPLSHVSEKHMQIMIDHFTDFAVVGEVSSTQGAGAQLKSWIIAYYTEPQFDEDCMTRIYCIPATDAAYKVLEGIESKLNGKMKDSQKLLIISNNNKNLQVTSKMTHEGWSAVGETQKSISFNVIWQCTEQSPNVSFIFERVSPQAFKFRSTFDARQEESDAGVEVIVTFTIQNDRRASSGYESQANGCQTDTKYQIPLEIRGELCLLLDPEKPMFNDWRRFSEKLEVQKVYTNNLENNPKIRSPTNELIDLWEKTLSEKIPLSRLEEIFVEMERHDVVTVLKKIPGF